MIFNMFRPITNSIICDLFLQTKMVASKSDSGKIKPESPAQPHQEDSLFSAPIRQSSVFSLTLEEYQVRSGKSFSSMNLDELLHSIWNANENLFFSSAHSQDQQNPDRSAADQTGHLHLPRQGSFSIPPLLCNKTIDEVWFEINKNKEQENPDNNGGEGSVQGQQTFGEVTLETFLLRAGVVQDMFPQEATDSFTAARRSGSFPNGNTNMDTMFGVGNMMGLGLSGSRSANNLPAYNGINGSNNKFPGESSKTKAEEGKGERAPQPGGQRGRKRATNEALEMAVERRQRRMIKNRESAARSRARKQVSDFDHVWAQASSP